MIFYFTGHGDQIPDYNNDKSDSMDEVLRSYNKKLIDDELRKRNRDTYKNKHDSTIKICGLHKVTLLSFS